MSQLAAGNEAQRGGKPRPPIETKRPKGEFRGALEDRRKGVRGEKPPDPAQMSQLAAGHEGPRGGPARRRKQSG